MFSAPLILAARDERNADQRLGIHRRARHHANARVEVRLVREHGLSMPRRPAGDALREADRRAHDLVGVHVADEHGLEDSLRLVRFVDRQRVVRDQVADVVGDADEERVEALLGEHLVEDVGEPPVRLDESGIPRLGAGVEKPKMARAGYHRSPDRSVFRCTFDASEGLGPQQTHTTSVRGPLQPSLGRVITYPMPRSAKGLRAAKPGLAVGPPAPGRAPKGARPGGQSALSTDVRETASRQRGVRSCRERSAASLGRLSRPSRSPARRRCPRTPTLRSRARPLPSPASRP